jgi:hypothetical protein
MTSKFLRAGESIAAQSSGIGDPREERPMFHVKQPVPAIRRAGKFRRILRQELTLSPVKISNSLTNGQFPGTSQSNGQIFVENPYILY